MLNTFAEFSQELVKIPQNERANFCREHQAELTDSLKSYHQVQKLFKLLTAKQAAIVTDILGDKLFNGVHDAWEFNQLMASISGKRSQIYFTHVNHLPIPPIESGLDFNNVMRHLPMANRDAVYLSVKDRLSGLASNAVQFFKLIECLDDAKRSEVFKQYQNVIPGFIKNRETFDLCTIYLNTEERIVVLRSLGDRLNSIVKHAFYFNSIMETWGKDVRDVLYDLLKDHLPNIFKPLNERYTIMRHLTEQQNDELFFEWRQRHPVSNDKWMEMVSSDGDMYVNLQLLLASVMKYLSVRASVELCVEMKTELRDCFQRKGTMAISGLLRPLSSEKRIAIYDAVLKDLLTDVKLHDRHDSYNFFIGINQALKYFNPEQIREFCEIAFKTSFKLNSRFIAFGLHALLDDLSTEQSLAALEIAVKYKPELRKGMNSRRVFEESVPHKLALIKIFNHELVGVLKKSMQEYSFLFPSDQQNEEMAKGLAKLNGINPDQIRNVGQAFKHIYNAIQASWSGIFKPSDTLLKEMDRRDDWKVGMLAMISAQHNPNSVTAEAWQLALKYVNNCNENNPELRYSIYSVSHSHSNLFHHSLLGDRNLLEVPAVRAALR